MSLYLTYIVVTLSMCTQSLPVFSMKHLNIMLFYLDCPLIYRPTVYLHYLVYIFLSLPTLSCLHFPEFTYTIFLLVHEFTYTIFLLVHEFTYTILFTCSFILFMFWWHWLITMLLLTCSSCMKKKLVKHKQQLTIHITMGKVIRSQYWWWHFVTHHFPALWYFQTRVLHRDIGHNESPQTTHFDV